MLTLEQLATLYARLCSAGVRVRLDFRYDCLVIPDVMRSADERVYDVLGQKPLAWAATAESKWVLVLVAYDN